MTAQTQTELQASNESGVLNINSSGTTQVQPTAKGFEIPQVPTFDSVEEKRLHVKERLACAFRYSSLYISSLLPPNRHPEYSQSMDTTKVSYPCLCNIKEPQCESISRCRRTHYSSWSGKSRALLVWVFWSGGLFLIIYLQGESLRCLFCNHDRVRSSFDRPPG